MTEENTNTNTFARNFKIPLNKKKIITIALILNFVLMGSVVFIKLAKDTPMVLVNQVGYFPNQEKVFLVQSKYVYYTGYYNIFSLDSFSDIAENQELKYLGRQWGYHYYSGNFTDLSTSGNFKIVVNLDDNVYESTPFKIGTNIYDIALERAYEFFYYQRCGVTVNELVPGYVGHEVCHTDDGVFLNDGVYYNNEWVNLTGGWHSAGDYAKHNYWGLHIEGCVYSMTFAYENVPDVYDAIDEYSLDGSLQSNGIPDILDESMFGIEYINKTFLKNGTMLGSLVGTLQFVPPEFDTDGIVGTVDDRVLFDTPGEKHIFANPYEVMWCVAGLGKFVNIISQKGVYLDLVDSINATAQYMYANYTRYYDFTQQGTNFQHWLPFMLGSNELYRLTGNADYAINSTRAFEILVSNFEDYSTGIMDDLGIVDRAFGLVAEWAIKNGSIEATNAVKDLVLNYWNNNWKALSDDATNFFGLLKMRTPEEYFFYQSNLGKNSRHLASVYAAILANNLTDGQYPEILNFAYNQLNWIFGKNPYSVCMMESIGTNNPTTWHHRYSLIDGNMRGAVPGAIANGMISKNENTDQPWFDTSIAFAGSIGDHPASAQANEPWLPHNVQALQALSVLVNYLN
jgi:endoglucanase